MKEVIDRVPTRPNRIKLTSESDGSINYYAWERADEPTVDGTPINKELFDSIGIDITSLQQTTSKNTSDIATNTSDIQAIKSRDDEQDANISSLEERLYKVNDGENTINTDGGLIRGIKLYGRSLQEGTPTPDNPIEIQSVVNPKLKVCGKNLVDKSIFTFSNQRIISQTFLEILPNTNYTFSVSNANGTDGVISIYDNDKNLINTYIQNASNPLLLSITTPSNAKYLRIDQWFIGIISSIDDIDIQLEIGSTATDFEPYQGNQATLPYTLNAIPVSSGGNVTIDGQQYIADYVDIENKKLVRMTEYVDVSTLSLASNTTLTNFKRLNYQKAKKPNLENIPTLCNRTIYKANYFADEHHCYSDAGGIYLFIPVNDNLPTTGEYYVLYTLATPITIDLTDEEVQAFKSLYTYEGVTNIIDSSDQISGSHKFIYNIAETIDNQYANIDKLKQLSTVTLGTTWEQDTTNGYYTHTVALSGITSKDNPTVDVVLSGTLENMQSQQEEWGKILKIETLDNTLKFYASEPTSVELSVMVKGV